MWRILKHINFIKPINYVSCVYSRANCYFILNPFKSLHMKVTYIWLKYFKNIIGKRKNDSKEHTSNVPQFSLVKIKQLVR